MKEQLTDADVVRLLRLNDERQHSRVLRFLYEGNRKSVVQFIWQRGGSKEDGEEMLSHAIMSFFENVRAGKFELRDDVRLSTYLITLAQNTWLKQVRKNRPWLGHTFSLQKEWATDVAQQEAVTSERHELLYELVAQLCERCQSLIQAVIDGYTMQDIAGRLGLGTANNAKAHKYRCLLKLKELYTHQS